MNEITPFQNPENNTQTERSTEEALQISSTATQELGNAAKWAKILAVSGFVGSGLFALFALMIKPLQSFLLRMGTYEQLNEAGSATTYWITAIILFAQSLFLYRFATETYNALHRKNNGTAVHAFGQLKIYFKLSGIILIVGLSLLAIGLLFIFIGAMLVVAVA